MPITRLMLACGAIFLGAVAIFMGGAVSISALGTGVIRYSHGDGAATVTHALRRDDDASAYWQALALIGGVPIGLGLAALVWARRSLRRQT